MFEVSNAAGSALSHRNSSLAGISPITNDENFSLATKFVTTSPSFEASSSIHRSSHHCQFSHFPWDVAKMFQLVATPLSDS